MVRDETNAALPKMHRLCKFLHFPALRALKETHARWPPLAPQLIRKLITQERSSMPSLATNGRRSELISLDSRLSIAISSVRVYRSGGNKPKKALTRAMKNFGISRALEWRRAAFVICLLSQERRRNIRRMPGVRFVCWPIVIVERKSQAELELAVTKCVQ